jgi:hypothetical protein
MLAARLISFHLSWNWNMDIGRESLRQNHPDLAEIAEEIIPFTASFLATVVTTVDEEDLKVWGQYVNTTLQERYDQAKEVIARAAAPIDPEILDWQQKVKT